MTRITAKLANRVLFAGLISVSVVGCAEETMSPTAKETASTEKAADVVYVNLGASSESLNLPRGEGTSVDRDGGRTVIGRPCRVRVSSGGHDVLSADTKLTFVHHPRGVIDEVTITFPAETVPFDQAVKLLRELLLSVPHVSPQEVDELFNAWLEDGAPKSVFDTKSGRVISDS